MKRTILFFLANILALTGFSQPQAPLFSAEELRGDFIFLRQKLETKHPNLYAFTPKTAMDALLDSLLQQLDTPATGTDFYNHIAPLLEKIGDGHTMFLPVEALSPSDTARFFPFYVAVKDDRLYVSMNCSDDTTVTAGSEILSINGTEARTVLRFLMARQVRDGFDTTYPHWILENYFKSYYRFSFGAPPSFTIEWRDRLGAAATSQVPAWPNDRILSTRKARYPNNRLDNRGAGVALKMDSGPHLAVLTLGTFDARALRKSSGHALRKTFKSLFVSLKKQGIEHLVLDLRDNQGGDFQTSRLLLKYLVRTPAQYLRQGFESRRISPKRNGFKGKLYVLINGGTFSAASIACSILQGEGRAVFIGEETGGNRATISGAARHHRLANTGIHAFVSKKTFLIRDEANAGRGVLPDYEAIPLPEEVGTGADSPMWLALDLIGKESKQQ